MQQGSGDFTSHYYSHHYPTPLPNPNPNPTHQNPNEFPSSNPTHPPFASAPPYSHYSTPEFPTFPSPYPSYSPNPDPLPNLPPSAPSFAQSQPQFPSFPPYNPPAFSQEQTPSTFPHLQQPYFVPESQQNYSPSLNPNPNPPNPSLPTPYENPYDNSGYFGENPSRYGFDRDFFEKKPESVVGGDDGLGDGVYPYDGGKAEPYGARGTGVSRSSSSSAPGSWARFDDYGRSLSLPSPGKDQAKIVRAVPKAETQQDVKNGVQKFRVKLLPEGASSTTTDVLCQIGLDGIRMLDPSTNRTLRIYPLETITRWEVLDSSIFAFWSKSSVDIDPRRIRIQSSSYTTNTILDTVTAAAVQLKEMGGKDSLGRSRGSADADKLSEQSTEKKKGLADWMNLMKPANVEKDHWVPDEAVSKCTSCGTDFGAFVRKHHCRNCGDIFCDKCTQGRIALTADDQPVRVCDRCMAEVSQRLSNAKELASKSTGLHSHEDLAKKLQEEMEKNRKSSSGSKPSTDGSGRRMREVACPICTVHLQVQVPSSGSETIECGVCQHPFLVSAH